MPEQPADYQLQRLPIWHDSQQLLLEVETAVRGFPRYHKYTVGSDLRRQAMRICQLLSRALSVGAAPGKGILRLAAANREKLQSTLASYLGHFSHAHSRSLLASLFRRYHWLDLLYSRRNLTLTPHWEPGPVTT